MLKRDLHAKAGYLSILCEVHAGTCRDAILFSVGANAGHGMKRTNADKRKSINTLLADSEWSGWSDNAIAKHCSIHHETVKVTRDEWSLANSQVTPADRKFVNKHGTISTMKTGNIGRKIVMPAQPPDATPALRTSKA